MKTPWQPLSPPGVTGRFLAVRLWDGDIHLAPCTMNGDNVERAGNGALYDRDDILALAGTLPEVQALVAAARNLRAHYASDWEFDYVAADRMDAALKPFEVKE